MALRRNAFHLLLYGTSTILTQGLTYFVLIPIGTRILTPTEYGVVEALQAYSAILIIFFSLYMSSAYTRYYYDFRDNRERLAALTTTCLLFTVGLGLLLAVPAYWIGRSYLSTLNVSHGRYVLILAVLLPAINILMAIASLSTAYLNQVHRNTVINVVSIIGALLSTSIAMLCLLQWGIREEAFFIATLIIQTISAAYGVYALWKEGLIVASFDMRLLGPCLIFALGSLPFSLCSYIWNLSDRIILGIYAGVDLLGKYALAYKMAMLLQVGYGQFWRVANPYLLSWLADHKDDDRRDLLRLISLYTLLLSLGGLFLIYFGPMFLSLMAPVDYQLDPAVLTVCVIAIMMLGVRKYTDCHLWYRKKLLTMFVLQGILPAAVNLGANLAFIPIFKEYAAAWSTLLSASLVLSVSIFVNLQLEEIPHRRSVTITVLITFIVGLAIAIALRCSNTGWSLATETLLLMLVYLGLAMFTLIRVGGLRAFRALIRPVATEAPVTGPRHSVDS